MEEEQHEWSRARIIFGRLIEIDKTHQSITLEYKKGDEWTSEEFSTKEGWTEQDYDDLLQEVGNDINLTVVDHEATDWEPSS